MFSFVLLASQVSRADFLTSFWIPEKPMVLLQKTIKVLKDRMFSLKLNSDLRVEGNTLILANDNLSIGCFSNEIWITGFSEKKGDELIEGLTYSVCGRSVGTLTLIRRGSNTVPMTMEQLLNADFPIPIPFEFWSLRTSWLPVKIDFYQDDHRTLFQMNYFPYAFSAEQLSYGEMITRKYDISPLSDSTNYRIVFDSEVQWAVGAAVPKISFYFQQMAKDPGTKSMPRTAVNQKTFLEIYNIVDPWLTGFAKGVFAVPRVPNY